MKRNLLLFVLLCNSLIFAQAPTISYSGVQSSYTTNTAMPTLTPTVGGGAPLDRTNVTTIAGSGTSGFADGSTASPKFYAPTGVAIAASGNIYIADSQNHCIRKITASGYVTTFAGSGVAGFLNGAASIAQFNTPYSIAVDASENVYVTEANSYSVRKITQAGVVSTLAGKETTSGFLDAQGANALFAAPKGLDVDASGNVYVADANSNRIRKISSTGVVTTIAGDGTAGYLDGQGTAARFNNPVGVAIGGSGIIYVTDASNNRIRAISASGSVTTIAGSGSPGMVNGQGTAAQFNAPRAIAVDASDNILVVDYNNNRIRKITSSGAVTTLAGTGAFGAVNGAGSSATFKYPEGLGIDASGNAFVADGANNCIRKVTSAGDTSTYAGSATRGLENGQSGTMAMFNSPVAVAVTSSGITYVIDDFNSCIRKVTANGIVSTFVGNVGTGYADGTGTAAYFNNPKGMCLDASGNIYVADTFNNRIRKITPSGVVTTIAGDGTVGYLDGQGTAAKFNNPYGLTVDTAGNIYVADTKNHRIRKISTSGAVTTVAGYILSGYADGPSTTARFKNPQGIAIDNTTGILYIVDTTNNRIRKIATDGTVSTFAGSFAGYSDDQGTAAYFNNPIGITIDGSGNFYIGDYYNSVIRKITSTGLVSTYAGSGSSEFVDGIGNVAGFYFPVGVTTDASGNVYVADSYTQRIRKITSVDPFAISPVLPTGMNFNTSTGVISGTPTEVRASMSYTIGASNYTGTGTTTITFATGTGGSTPSAPTASAQSFCNAATVSNLVATGTALQWYAAATGGTALASTTALTTTTYYVSQTVNSVESSRTAVSVTINTTSAPAATAQTFCSTATVANLVATGTSLKWYNVSSGGTALASTTALTTGNYYVSQTLNSCESSRTTVAVTLNTTTPPTASAQSFCSSASVANLVATGTSLKWYTIATGGTALSSTQALATGTYYVSQTLNSCESSRTSVAVTINTTAAPTASAQTYNSGADVGDLIATGTNLQWYTTATGGTVLASTTILSTGTYYVSQTLNGCESTRTAVSVTINTAPGAPTASAQTFCNSGTVANLVATGTALKWYNVATGGTALASTTALSTGTYYVSQTVNSLESSRTAVSVTVNVTAAPTAAAQSFCNAASVANLVATGTSLKWYSSVTGGTALASTTALATGTYYVSQTLNSCEGSRTSVTVTINTTAAPTASAQTYNSGADVADLIATGTNLQWYASATGGTALASTTILSTGTYYVSQTLNGCESTRTAVSVTINTAPGAPTASAQAFCNSATVANLVATGTALKWYSVATGGTALASTTALSTGTYYVSQTVNSLESTRTAVSVTINVTAAPAASAQTFNSGADVADLTATGTNLQWYASATGGTALASTTILSTGTYYVSQTLNGCEGTRTAVSVTINTAPGAPMASAQTFCSGADVADLVATGTSLKWYNVATGGSALASTTILSTGTYYVSQTVNSLESARTAVSVTINVTAAPAASAQTFNSGADVADLTATGTNLQWYASATGGTALASTMILSTGTYYVSQTLNGCESTRTAVSVTINTAPGAPTASAQTFCSGADVADLVATGTNLKWYNVATGGSALASTTILSTGTYYVSQTINSLESARTAVSVTVNTTAAPTASAQTFNSGADVADLVATGTNLQWYTSATGGTALASTTILSTGTYYVSQTLNGCEGARTAVSVTINTAPGAPTASAQTFCSGADVADLVATGTNLKWYNVATGGTALASTTILSTGTYYVSQTVNSIESARTPVSITVHNTPMPSVSSQTFCSGATVANLVATGTNIQWFTVGTGGTALASTTTLTSGILYVSQTLNGCESARTIIGVTINNTAAPTASAQTFNNGADVADLVATGTNLKWYTTALGGTALASTAILSTGTYYVSQTLNGCESTRTAVSVTINAIPGAPTAVAQVFCNSAIVADLEATGTALQWYTSATGGTALASTAALTTATYYVSQTVNSVESARTTVAVTINVTATPTASAQTFCNSGTVANLAATGTNLQWYSASTGGTALASTTALSTATYYVSQTLNSCESARTAVTVTVNVTPPPTASSQSFCGSAMISNMVATGTNLKWYNLVSGGNVLPQSTGLVTGFFYVSQTLNGCESPRTQVSVTVNATPAPTASAQAFNSGATVANLAATGTNLQWYSASTGGTALASTTALATGTYYVSQTLSGCESTRTAVSVTINIVTGAPTASPQTFCNSATVANLVATGTSLKWYNVASGGTALASTTALTTATYYVSQTVNSVESARTAVSVTVNVTAAPTASSQNFCNSATVANLAATGTSLKWYTVTTGGTALASTSALVTGNYYVSQTLNSCESARTLVIATVYVTALPTASPQTFNTGATVANLVATGTSLKWYNVATGGTALASTTALATGNYYVTQTLNSCESLRKLVAVTVNTTTTVSAPTATAQSFCSASTVSNLVATGTSLKWYTSASGGTALSSNTVLSNGNYYVSQTVNSVESPRTLVTVTIYGAPTPKNLNNSTASGSARSPICTSSIKTFTVKSGYSAGSITWERAVMPLNSNFAPLSSDYEAIDGASGPSYTVTDAVPGKIYYRAKFMNGNCEISAAYSSPEIVFYRDCDSAKMTAVSYPNPYIETFKISMSTPNADKIVISVYDMMGKLMEQRDTTLEEIGDLQLGEHYPTGIYNVVVAQGDGIKTLRVIKR
ncbi:T9SS type A sorting domain-containing protein [Flavobacterium wongokense]|uniref:Ig-like domain-containing protein n=1 Tax=Flavobacterium wongokense TaxID=2910674 RepID=UPI001F3CAA2B|nr:T9SS type A sorting domain-containing protein [Flavobacterium sp. WG47]MCF6130751.1 T9SS type A sorting domain-containing protein [Flavobacterium sp. WG47]